MPTNPAQNFIDKQGPIVGAAWLNLVDLLVNGVFQNASTPLLAREAITFDAPLEVVSGGTGARDPIDALANLGGQPILLQTPGELTAGILPINPQFIPGDIRRYGAKADNGVTDDTVAIQQALTANAGYFPVYIWAPNNQFYSASTMLTVPANSEVIFVDGAEIRWSATQATGPVYLANPPAVSRPGLVLAGNNISIHGQGTLTGPSGPAVYTGSEVGIIAVGGGITFPLTNIRVRDLELRFWGSDGYIFKWVQNWEVLGCYIHDCGYAGMHALSCVRGTFRSNEVGPIGPGTAGNAYGFSGTFDATQPSGGTRQDPNRFCIGIDVSDNFIHDNPLWIGIDFHGAYECNVHHNRVYNCWTGIQIGAGNAFGGEDNAVDFNEVYSQQFNGGSSTIINNNPIAISVTGGPSSLMPGARVVGNSMIGYGNNQSPPTAWTLQLAFLDRAVVMGNDFRNWSGFGIHSQNCNGGVMIGNTFGPVANSYVNDSCIYSVADNTPWTMIGNSHHIAAGTPAHFGITLFGSPAGPMLANDFASAVISPYGNGVGSPLGQNLFAAEESLINAINGFAVGAGQIVNSKFFGTATFSGVSSLAVSIGGTLPSNSFKVQLTPSGAQPPSAPWVTARTTSGFTINFSAAFTGTVDWTVEQ